MSDVVVPIPPGSNVTLPDIEVTAPKFKPPAVTPASKPANVTATRLPTDGVDQTGSPLWIRMWKLSVGPVGGGQAMDLSQFSFEFEVTMGQSATPWKARVKIWNPPPELAAKIGTKEYTNIQLDAGYASPSKQYGNVIKGQINFLRYGKQNATDTFLELHMTMHDTAYTAAIVNTWLPAGSTKDQVINAVLAALAPYGVTRGQITKMSEEKSPRGRAMAGMARDFMDDIARTENAKWFIDKEGKFHLLKQTEILEMGNVTVPKLNSRSGMIDVPVQCLGNGIEVHCLLNPNIRPGGRIQVNERDITKLRAIPGGETFKTEFQSQDPLTAAIRGDGIYKVGQVKHWGQNRGNPWYSFITTDAFENQKPTVATTI